MKKLNLILLVSNILSLSGIAYLNYDLNKKIDRLWVAHIAGPPTSNSRVNYEMALRKSMQIQLHPFDWQNEEEDGFKDGDEKRTSSYYFNKYSEQKTKLSKAISNKEYEEALKILSSNF